MSLESKHYFIPFTRRVTLYIALKGLGDVISVDVVDPVINPETGWEFSPEKRGCTPDRVNGKKYMKEIYQMSHPNYTGRITVPVLFDKKTGKIVSNESADIIRMLNHEFNDFCSMKSLAVFDLYPKDNTQNIDEVNEFLNRCVINKGYTTDSSLDNDVYNRDMETLFNALDELERILSSHRFLVGNSLCESDIRLFVFLVRFDLGYASIFKCHKKKVRDYKNLWAYTRDIYQLPYVRATVNFDHISDIYWKNKKWNPSGVVPSISWLDLNEYTGRDKMFPAH